MQHDSLLAGRLFSFRFVRWRRGLDLGLDLLCIIARRVGFLVALFLSLLPQGVKRVGTAS